MSAEITEAIDNVAQASEDQANKIEDISSTFNKINNYIINTNEKTEEIVTTSKRKFRDCRKR